MEFSEKMHQCIRNGIKVYPIWKRNQAYISVNIIGQIKVFDKPLNSKKEINEALAKTYEHYFHILNPNYKCK